MLLQPEAHESMSMRIQQLSTTQATRAPSQYDARNCPVSHLLCNWRSRNIEKHTWVYQYLLEKTPSLGRKERKTLDSVFWALSMRAGHHFQREFYISANGLEIKPFPSLRSDKRKGRIIESRLYLLTIKWCTLLRRIHSYSYSISAYEPRICEIGIFA